MKNAARPPGRCKMLFRTILKVSIKSLLANKLRSFLAVLGIIFGVGAVISMLALGAGAEEQVMSRISAMGANLMVVRPGQRGHRGVQSESTQDLTLEDAKAILEQVEGIEMLSPVVRGGAQVKYENKNTRTTIYGTAVTYMRVRNYTVEHGRPFTEGESDRQARVALIGAAAVENLFEDESPLEKTVKVNGMNFKIVGVLKEKGDQGWFNPDDQLIIPYTTAMKQLLGEDNLREIDLEVKDGVEHESVESGIKQLLRQRHRLREGQEDDFNIRSMTEFAETATDVGRTFTILLGAVAGISLLVGGIGIMNIMLVTVTERTREIGVRKAIGAEDSDILRQFLLEAVIMSVLGGLIGVGAGIGAAELIGRLTEFSTLVKPSGVFPALLFSVAVGVFFGWYPASRAAALDPIDALRYE